MPYHASAAASRFAAVHPASPVMALLLAQKIFIRHAARAHRFFHGGVHRVKLVITRDDFVQTVAVRIFFKHDEMLEQVEKAFRLEHPAHQHLQLQRSFNTKLA